MSESISVIDRIKRRTNIINRKISGLIDKGKLIKHGNRRQKEFESIKCMLQEKTKNKQTLNVGFIGYQDAGSCDVFTTVYNKFSGDDRFNVTVIIAPYTHDTKEDMIIRQHNSETYLKNQGIPYVKGYDQERDVYVDYHNKFDIVFFEIEYDWMRKEFKAENFPNALSYLIPYGEYLADNILNAHFRSRMMYDIYKIFPPGKAVYDMMCDVSYLGKRNVGPFLGNPKLDSFFEENYVPKESWKKIGCNTKKIIWAPHHIWADYGNFLEYKDIMIELAVNNKETLQIAFKPHPALAASLIEVGGWTQQEVDNYYKIWENMPNTQYEGQEWIDLFLTSDAMLLDSIGFMAEYSITGKPACVIYREDEKKNREKRFSICGEKIYDKLYHAKNKQEVVAFVQNIVLNDNDYMQKERVDYILGQYRPPLTGNAGDNIYTHICSELGLIDNKFFEG